MTRRAQRGPHEHGIASPRLSMDEHASASPYVWHRTADVTLCVGDAHDVLASLPDVSVDCVVTSPPYWRLRDYGTGRWSGGEPGCLHPHAAVGMATTGTCVDCGAGWDDVQLGREPTAAEYIDRLRTVFADLARVLVPTGTVWLNLGDSYAANSDGYRCGRPGHPGQPNYRPRADRSDKNLLGMPWRTAFALQDDGWILRNAVVWHKPHAVPTPARDRLACHHEMLFLLVRQERYYFDLDPIRQPYTGDRALSRRAHRGGTKPTTATGTWPLRGLDSTGPTRVPGRNPGDVWTLPTGAPHGGRPVSFPLELPVRCIAAGCPPGGLVLDPFCGASTTGLAARQLGRRYLGIDLNPDFHGIALAHLGLSKNASEPSTEDPSHRGPP
ncbi:DNA-methyltransferase [Streptodolium elevatio]|uniref:Methyltransferase n=1 Tax=Streptodolium elevatio TaxID=3157996 RepID=A0ABV3DB12_9ACTN